MLIVFFLAVTSFGVQFHPRFLSSSWDTYRMILYSSVAGYGVVPALHWTVLNGGIQSEIVQVFIYTMGCIQTGNRFMENDKLVAICMFSTRLQMLNYVFKGNFAKEFG